MKVKLSQVYSKLTLWCRGQGLNLRRLGLQPSALPGWATSAQRGAAFVKEHSLNINPFCLGTLSRCLEEVSARLSWKSILVRLQTGLANVLRPRNVQKSNRLVQLPENTWRPENLHAPQRYQLTPLFSILRTCLMVIVVRGKVLWRENT